MSLNDIQVADRAAFASETGLDEETVKTLYGYFAEEIREDIGGLAASAAALDHEAYARFIHKIKGTSSSYHAERVAFVATKADAFCKEGSHAKAFGLLDPLRMAVEEALHDIEAWG